VHHAGEQRAVADPADREHRARVYGQAAAVMRSLAADLTIDDPDHRWFVQAAAALEGRARQAKEAPAPPARVLRLVR
jgi:hypothetical protein